jgi:hypothetical protein
MTKLDDIERIWEDKKLDLIDNIDTAIESGETDKDILELMKEFIKGAKVKSSIGDYFNEQNDDGGK